MKPRLTMLTLLVDDLDRAFNFYHLALGWPSPGIVGREFEHGAVAFFRLEGGLQLALWPRRSFSHETGLPESAQISSRTLLSHNMHSTAEVDQVLEQVKSAGAPWVKAAAPTFWGGYAGYFQDPDQHVWEVVFNPKLIPMDAD